MSAIRNHKITTIPENFNHETSDDALTTNQPTQNESFPSPRQSSPISNCSLFNIKNK